MILWKWKLHINYLEVEMHKASNFPLFFLRSLSRYQNQNMNVLGFWVLIQNSGDTV